MMDIWQRKLTRAHTIARLGGRASMITSAGFGVLAVLSVTHQAEAFAMVDQHFGEPFSVYPAANVAALLLMLAGMAAGSWAIFSRLERLMTGAATHGIVSGHTAGLLMAIAALVAAMELARFPIAAAALTVETAFKGPTSEIGAGAPVAGLLAAFALAVTAATIRAAASGRADNTTAPTGAEGAI